MPIQRSRNSLNSMYSALNEIGSANRRKDDDKKPSYEVEGLFKPLMKNGKFKVILRFLPAKVGDGDEIPWVENRSHLFQLENGQWFGCDCVGKFKDKDLKCPICEYNSKIWNKYGKTDEARAKVLGKWQPKYYSNVYIVKNENQPDTEGKVYRLEYKRAIMGFITDAIADKKDDETGQIIPGINPFSYYGPNDKCVLAGDEKAGANFVWEGIQGSNGPSYKTSHFNAPRRICKLAADGKMYDMTDDEIEAVDAQLYTLKDIEIPKEKYRSYSSIVETYEKKSGKKLFEEFMDGSEDYAATTKAPQQSSMQTTVVNDDDIFGGSSNQKQKMSVPGVSFTETDSATSMPFDEDEDSTSIQASVTTVDDSDDFFAKLANS